MGIFRNGSSEDLIKILNNCQKTMKEMATIVYVGKIGFLHKLY